MANPAEPEGCKQIDCFHRQQPRPCRWIIKERQQKALPPLMRFGQCPSIAPYVLILNVFGAKRYTSMLATMPYSTQKAIVIAPNISMGMRSCIM